MHTTRDKHALEDLRSAECCDERTTLCLNKLELYRTGSRYILYDMFQHTSHIDLPVHSICTINIFGVEHLMSD